MCTKYVYYSIILIDMMICCMILALVSENYNNYIKAYKMILYFILYQCDNFWFLDLNKLNVYVFSTE